MPKSEQSKKVKFPKHSTIEVFDCNEHEMFGLSDEQSEDRLTFSFWKNPSKKHLQSIFVLLLRTADELREMNDQEIEIMLADFYNALSSVIVDTNIDGLDFSTPESAQESYEDAPELPWGFVHEVLVTWLMQYMSEQDLLKKMLPLLFVHRSSGQEKREEASESVTD